MNQIPARTLGTFHLFVCAGSLAGVIMMSDIGQVVEQLTQAWQGQPVPWWRWLALLPLAVWLPLIGLSVLRGVSLWRLSPQNTPSVPGTEPSGPSSRDMALLQATAIAGFGTVWTLMSLQIAEGFWAHSPLPSSQGLIAAVFPLIGVGLLGRAAIMAAQAYLRPATEVRLSRPQDPGASQMSPPGDAPGHTLSDEPALPVPEGLMQTRATPGQWVASFKQTFQPVLTALLALPCLVLPLIARGQFGSDDQADAMVWGVLSLAGLLLIGLALHVGTRRWLIRIEPQEWWLDRSSALRSNVQALPPRSVAPLSHQLVYSSQSGSQASVPHHRVTLKTPTGQVLSLTPAFPGAGVALGVIERLTKAQATSAQGSVLAEGADTLPTTSITLGQRISTGVLWLLLALISLGVSSKVEEHLPQGPTQAWFSWKASMISQGKVLLGVGKLDRALVQAVDQDQDDQVEQALENGADPNATGDSGSSVLMLAASRGKLSTVEILLRHGADVNFADQTSVNERGDTALLRAAYFGEAAMFERLLKAGARVDVVNRWDWTPVHMAAMGGCIPCLETLRSRGLSLNARAPASRGESPLMLAASRGQVEAMAWLLARGAEPLQTDSHGHNALGWARFFKARSGPSEAWLLEHVPALADGSPATQGTMGTPP